MKCCVCHERATTFPDATLCEECRLAEFRRLETELQQRKTARKDRLRREKDLQGMPPALAFVLNIMIEAQWSEVAVAAAQRTLTQLERPLPAAFAYLGEE